MAGDDEQAVRLQTDELLRRGEAEEAAQQLMDFATIVQAVGAGQADGLRQNYARTLAALGSRSSAAPLREWQRFVAVSLRLPPGASPAEIATSLVQAAYAHGTASPITQAADRWLKRRGPTRHWLRLVGRPPDPADSPLVQILDGHHARVRAVAISADGNRAVSLDCDGELRVWDLRTGAMTVMGGPASSAIHDLSMTPDGSRAVCAGGDLVLVWDLDSGASAGELAGHTDPVSDTAITPDGRRVVSTGGDGALRVWDVLTGRCHLTLAAHLQRAISVALSADGQRAISVGSDHHVRLWDLDAIRCVHELELRYARGVALSGDGSRALLDLAAGLSLLEWNDPSIHHLLNRAWRSRYCLAMTPDGSVAVGAVEAGTQLIRYDLARCEPSQALDGPQGVTAIAVDAAASRVVAGYRDGTVRIWRGDGRDVPEAPVSEDRVTAVAMATDGSIVAGHAGGTVAHRHADPAAAETHRQGEPGSPVRSVALRSDGLTVWTSGGVLRVGDPRANRVERTIDLASEAFAAQQWVGIDPAGRRALSLSLDRSYQPRASCFQLWNLDDSRCERRIERNLMIVRAGAINDGGTIAALADDDHRLVVLSLETGDRLHTLPGHPSDITAVAVTPDGRLAMSSGADGMVRVWEIATGRRHTLTELQLGVCSVAISPAGDRAASVSEDGAVLVWDLEVAGGDAVLPWELEAAARLARWHGSSGRPCCCAMTESRLAVGHGDGNVVVLQIEPPGRLRTDEDSGVALPSPPTSACWHPRLPLLAVGCEDGSVVVLDWHEDTGFLEAMRHGRPELHEAIRAVQWSADGRFFRCAGATETRVLALGSTTPLPAEDPRWTTATRHDPAGRYEYLLADSEVLVLPLESP